MEFWANVEIRYHLVAKNHPTPTNCPRRCRCSSFEVGVICGGPKRRWKIEEYVQSKAMVGFVRGMRGDR